MAKVLIEVPAVVRYLGECEEAQATKIRTAACRIADELTGHTHDELVRLVRAHTAFPLEGLPGVTAVYWQLRISNYNQLVFEIQEWDVTLTLTAPPFPADPWELSGIVSGGPATLP